MFADTHIQLETSPCQPHKRKWRQMPPCAFCTEKFTKCPTQICHHILFLPPHTLQHGHRELTEKVLISCTRRFFLLSISCFKHTSPRPHTILPTAQRENGCAVIALRANAPAPNQPQRLDRKNTVLGKNIGS